jgi:hypothetical protein
MIKKLLFTAALLSPGIAYAQNPSADLSVQVVPAGSGPIACDIGPAYTGQIPAGAKAAGFTHCAANFDFTQAQFSNPATWLNCAGASTPIFTFNNQGGSAPCGAVSVVTDGSSKVLDMHWDPSWQPFSEIDPVQLFQEGVYMDFVLRYSASMLTGNSGETLMGGIYSESNNCCSVTSYEWDLDEQAIKPGYGYGYTGTHSVSWPLGSSPLGGGGNVPSEFWTVSGFNPTQYNDYGVRITTNGTTGWALCNYFNGTFESCGAWTAGATIASADQYNRWKIVVGPLSSTHNNGTAYDMFLQRWTIWTCPAWSPSTNAQCNNSPPLSTAP